MKNVFITGGAGFVGRNLRKRLERHEGVESILIYDRAIKQEETIQFYDSARQIETRVRFHRGDVGDLEHLTFWMKGYDTVIHLASNADISKAVSDPALDFREGTVLTHNVLEAMRVNGVKHLIYFSGSGVYGDDPHRIWSETDGPLTPISPYGASKLASEAMIAAYSYMLDLTATVFRPANLVGPRQTHGVGYDFIRQLKANPALLTMMGDGTQEKSYLFIDDAINAVLYIAGGTRARFEVYNLASEDRMTVNAIAEQAALTMGCHPEIRRTTANRGWKGDVPVIRMDCAKIHLAGWRPKWNSTQAMRAALEDMRKEIL